MAVIRWRHEPEPPICDRLGWHPIAECGLTRETPDGGQGVPYAPEDKQYVASQTIEEHVHHTGHGDYNLDRNEPGAVVECNECSERLAP